jgi:hypothetical protein
VKEETCVGFRDKNVARLKRAELASGIGAGVLGAGIGLLFSRILGTYAVPMLITGVFLHAWGMFDKHRLERGSAVQAPWWSTALYIVCWAALLLLAVYIMVRQFR